MNKPHNISKKKTANGIRLTRYWFYIPNILNFIAPLLGILLSMSIFIDSFTAIGFFLIITIFFTIVFFSLLLGFIFRTYIILDQTKILSYNSPFRLRKAMGIKTSHIHSAFVKENPYESGGTIKNSYSVNLILHSQEEIPLIKELPSWEEAQYIEEEIKVFLGLITPYDFAEELREKKSKQEVVLYWQAALLSIAMLVFLAHIKFDPLTVKLCSIVTIVYWCYVLYRLYKISKQSSSQEKKDITNQQQADSKPLCESPKDLYK
ncbi:MAG: hypothetical protein AAF518_27400 [Spirochaetota bacterium]